MSQVGVEKLGVSVFFYSSCHTWFIRIIEGDGERETFRFLLTTAEPPLGSYSSNNPIRVMLMHMIVWRKEKFLLVEMCILVFLYLSIVTVIDNEYDVFID